MKKTKERCFERSYVMCVYLRLFTWVHLNRTGFTRKLKKKKLCQSRFYNMRTDDLKLYVQSFDFDNDQKCVFSHQVYKCLFVSLFNTKSYVNLFTLFYVEFLSSPFHCTSGRQTRTINGTDVVGCNKKV